MFDYSLEKNDKKSFILYYKKVGNKLRVYLANGKKELISNTDDNELYLLNQMEKQITDVSEFKKRKEKIKKTSLGYFFYNMCFATINAIFMVLNPGLITGIIATLFVLCSTANIGTYINNKRILNDIKKHELFIKNKMRINENLKQNNDEDKLTINDIHSLKSIDIEKLIAPQDVSIAKPKVLTKKYGPHYKKNN